MTLDISVVICSHNPKPAYLDRVLAALKAQTLPQTDWELLLVDNASSPSLAETIDLSWHLNSRHILEPELGVVFARFRGLKEIRGPIAVFVDDDNVLEPDYLQIAVEIGANYPILGVWGGQASPEFDGGVPEDWTRSAWPMLAISQFDQDAWSNLEQAETLPVGAGMCLRKTVAQKYISLVQEDGRRLSLGRRGELLISCEDFDIALAALDIGLGMGKFIRLKLTHILPIRRVSEKYLLNLVKGIVYSRAIMDFLRNKPAEQLPWRTKARYFVTSLLLSPRDRRFLKVTKEAQALAAKQIQQMKLDEKQVTIDHSSYQQIKV